jgi:hypothetical protein
VRETINKTKSAICDLVFSWQFCLIRNKENKYQLRRSESFDFSISVLQRKIYLKKFISDVWRKVENISYQSDERPT